jgi:hypothetical protein
LDDGTVMNIVLQNVKYVPDLAPYNLFSITQAISNGWSLGNHSTQEPRQGFEVQQDAEDEEWIYVGGAAILPQIEDNLWRCQL